MKFERENDQITILASFNFQSNRNKNKRWSENKRINKCWDTLVTIHDHLPLPFQLQFGESSCFFGGIHTLTFDDSRLFFLCEIHYYILRQYGLNIPSLSSSWLETHVVNHPIFKSLWYTEFIVSRLQDYLTFISITKAISWY